LIENIGKNEFIAALALEGLGIFIVFMLFVVATIDFIKDNKKEKEK